MRPRQMAAIVSKYRRWSPKSREGKHHGQDTTRSIQRWRYGDHHHHHLLHATRRVNGGILWANLHLLFWLSLIPFATGWMGENHFAAAPTALYGFTLMMAAIAYRVLQNVIIATHGKDSALAAAVGNDVKGKLSIVLYLAAIPLAFVQAWIAGSLYVLVALMWLIPDRRIEHALLKTDE